MTKKVGLPAVVDARSRVLILGMLPGDESLRRQQYYAHPRNAFWPILAELTGEVLPEAYPDRLHLALEHGFALWDVLHAAERRGSLDAAIRNPQPNDFTSLLRQWPAICVLAFNGAGPHAAYRRHIAKVGGPYAGLAVVDLPSSSPAHARQLEDKAASWAAALAPYLPR